MKARRRGFILIAVMIVIGSLGMIGAGAVVLAAGDTDGHFAAGPVQLTTDATALVGDDLDIFIDGPFVDRVALERLGAATAWMVGDTPDDLRAARAAGLKCVVIPHALTQYGDFTGAYKILDSLAELPGVLEADSF